MTGTAVSTPGSSRSEAGARPRLKGIAEAPRYSCALGGAYTCTLATFRAVPILHSGPGCVLAQNFGQNFAAGLNGAGPNGNTAAPCSCLVEEHVVFGGESKLEALVKSTRELVKGNLYVVISGCVPALIGDDVSRVVRGFQEDEAPVVHVPTAGFVGNSYKGYEIYLDAMVEQLMVARPKVPRTVNLLGIVPYQHPFWKGDLATLRSLLASIGVRANMIFTEDDGLAALRAVPAAELNLLFSPWSGRPVAEKLEQRFGTPHLDLPAVPVGPKDTADFLRKVGDRLGVGAKVVEDVIGQEEHRAYRFTEYAADIATMMLPHAFVGLVGDAGTVVGLTRYVSNELSWLPEVVIVTDDPPPEQRESIRRLLTERLESVVKPEVIFEEDSHRIRLELRKHTLQVLLASSLEKHIATDELSALQVSVAFPIYDRLIVDRTYAGFRGGLALLEDVAFKYGGPL